MSIVGASARVTSQRGGVIGAGASCGRSGAAPDARPGMFSEPGLGAHVAEAFVRAREAMRPHDRKHADERLTSWLENFETDMRDIVAPHLAKYADHPDVPADLQTLFRTASDPQHQFQAGFLLAVVGALAYPLVSAAMSGPAQGLQNVSLAAEVPVPLSPAEAALAVVRHTAAPDEMEQEAKYGGLSPHRFGVMVKNTGEAPAIGELLLAYRRGQIDHDRLITGIRQSRLRDEWADVIIGLRYAPPSTGEAIAAAVQGHLTPDEARAKVEDAGINPAEFDWMLETAGRPPGAEQLLHLLNRGFLDEPFVRSAIRESDIKNKYIDAIIESRHYIPPVRSVVAMRRNHALDDDQFRRLMRNNGVRDEDITIYLAEASRARTTSQRDLSVSQIVKAYETQLLDRAAAHARLVDLHYDDTEANMVLDLADHARHDTMVRAAAARVHNLYVAHKIDRSDATVDLDRMGVPHAARDEWLALWTLEREANVATLTLAQTQGALRRGMIDLGEFRGRVRAMGYRPDDIEILASEAFPPPKAPKALTQRDLSVAQITKAYRAQLIDRTTALAQVRALGYDAAEAELIVHLAET